MAKLSQYIKKSKKPEHLPLEVEGEVIDDIYLRRLSAGEGIELKDAFADLIESAGDTFRELADGSAEEVEKKAKKNLSPEQMRAMFRFQAMFTYLHLSDKDGNRPFESRKEFDQEFPDDLIPAFYSKGSELKNKTQPDQEDAEKNSSTPTD